MRYALFIATCIIAVILPADGRAASACVFDLERSSVAFTARLIFGLPLDGQFAKFGGNLAIDEDRVDRSTATIVVETASVDTQNPDTDDLIRSQPMLDSETHPTAVLTISEFAPAGAAKMMVDGELTLKSVRLPVQILITYRPSPNGKADGERAARRVIADGDFEIQRLQFDVGTGPWSSTFLFHDRIAVKAHFEMLCP